MATKKELLTEIPFEFLRSFAVRTEIIRTRGLYHTKKDHVKALVRSLTKPETYFLYNSHKNGVPIDRVSEQFLLKHRPNDQIIRDEMAEFLKKEYGCQVGQSVLFEVPVKSNRADIMVIQDDITIFEIKSPRDSYRRLDEQIGTYAEIADYVNVVYPSGKEPIDKFDTDIGEIQFDYPDFCFNEVHSGRPLTPPIEDRMSVLWDSEVSAIMEHVFSERKENSKRSMVEKKLCNSCTKSELNACIRYQLKNRVRDRGETQSQATLMT